MTSTIRRALRRVPAAGWLCALVALLNATAWALFVPPFQVPDEFSHFSYVQRVAETGRLPLINRKATIFSQEERGVLDALNALAVGGNREDKPPRTADQQAIVRAVERAGYERAGIGNARNATNNPPLYYALEVPVYWASPSHLLLNRLLFMRFLSVFFTALTTLAIFLFLRELLPHSPLAWTVGSLAVAFQPLLGFIGSGVNPDSLGFLTAAVTFLAIARGFRRGLDVPTALAIGGSVAAGALTKPLFLGLAPAALLAIVLLARRPGPDGGSRPLRAAGLAVLTAALPVLAFAILGPLVWDHGLFGANGVGDVLRSGSAEPGAGTATNLREELSYIWQLFLPALPFMHDVFPGTPLWWVWFKGFVGQFGYLDYGFPSWADTVAAVALIGVGLAAAAVLVRRRTALAARLPELACYAVATIGICGVIGVADWHAALGHDDLFHQARYLMPLLALYAAIVGLCIGVAGRRTRAVAAVAIVGVAAVHSLAAFVLTLDRYYG